MKKIFFKKAVGKKYKTLVLDPAGIAIPPWIKFVYESITNENYTSEKDIEKFKKFKENNGGMDFIIIEDDNYEEYEVFKALNKNQLYLYEKNLTGVVDLNEFEKIDSSTLSLSCSFSVDYSSSNYNLAIDLFSNTDAHLDVLIPYAKYIDIPKIYRTLLRREIIGTMILK